MKKSIFPKRKFCSECKIEMSLADTEFDFCSTICAEMDYIRTWNPENYARIKLYKTV